MEKKLYQWQQECLERWWANEKRGMVQAVTGAGKTRLALTAIERLLEELQGDLRVKIVVPTGGLMRQWNRALREFLEASETDGMFPGDYSRTIGLRGGGHRDSADYRYMIYVINSARYELAREILKELKNGENVLLIADECHHYESGQNRMIFEFLPYIEPYKAHFFSLGLSATLPSGQTESYLASVLGKKIYNYGIKKASAFHTVCPYDVYHISLSFQKGEREEYDSITERMQLLYRKLLSRCPELSFLKQKERFEALRKMTGEEDRSMAEAAVLYLKLAYKRKNLVCLASARCSCACDLAERLGIENKIMIFGERICQAEELYRYLQERYPGRVGRYHSKMGQQANRNTLERFRDGILRILVTCKAADEGIDLPDAAVGIILSGTSNQRQKIQRLGRILRKHEGKDCAALYYLYISETSEEGCFLPTSESRHIFDLEYRPEEHRFIQSLYDDAAAMFLRDMQKQRVDETKLREAARCLCLGAVRSDWTLEKDIIEMRIKEARYVRDRNYWICMKKMSEYRKEKSQQN